MWERNVVIRTFTFHSDLETFLEATVLALVAMMLVHGTVSSSAARIRQVATDRALEEALAAFARELPIVLTGTLVAADDAVDTRRYRKSARDVTARRRALSVPMTASRAVAVAVTAAVANGNGHLLDEVSGAKYRRRPDAALAGGGVE